MVASKFALRVGAAALLGISSMAAQAVPYEYVQLSRPGSVTTQAFDVNNLGQIAGYSIDADGGSQAFIYSNNAFTALSGPAGALSTWAMGISDTGVVVGSFTSESLDGPQRSFIYDGSSYTTFTIAGANDTFLRAISPDARYVSGYYTSDTVFGQGFVYDMLTSNFVLLGGGGEENFTIAQGVSNGGVVVGSDILLNAPASRPGFTYDIGTGVRTDVNLPGAQRTAFRAIDESGVISGWYRDVAGTHGFTGYPGALQTIDMIGAFNTFVEGSNDAGVLVGNYDIEDFYGAFIARRVAVPEPQTLLLLVVGLVGLMLTRRFARS